MMPPQKGPSNEVLVSYSSFGWFHSVISLDCFPPALLTDRRRNSRHVRLIAVHALTFAQGAPQTGFALLVFCKTREKQNWFPKSWKKRYVMNDKAGVLDFRWPLRGRSLGRCLHFLFRPNGEDSATIDMDDVLVSASLILFVEKGDGEIRSTHGFSFWFHFFFLLRGKRSRPALCGAPLRKVFLQVPHQSGVWR
jgi:hypothetical protein